MVTRTAPRVLYHCQCHLGVLSAHDAEHEHGNHHPHGADPSSSSSAHKSLDVPALPSQVPAARYFFHPLALLYFCTDCLAPRCSLCSMQEILTHYCPSCLFEVPSASVKAERNRCPRNCFLCPTKGCGSYLTVAATDPATGSRLESTEASIGTSPYYLSCVRCKWDSKKGTKGGLGVFEKPTGISAQLEAQRGTFAGQAEMDKLRSHFDSFLRKQQQQQQQQQQQSSGSSKLPSLPSSLSKSKLFRDVPGLSDSSKYLTGSRRGGAGALGLADQQPRLDDQPPPYQTDYAASSYARPSNSGDDRDGQPSYSGNELGVMGQREEHHRKVLRRGKDASEPMVLDLTGHSLWERYQSGWDVGPLGTPNSSLEPLRVPLQTKKTLRCPACRHILVKPDAKATSYRFKIKNTALSYLPPVQVSFKGVKGRPQLNTVPSLTKRTSTLSLRPAATAAGSSFLSPSAVSVDDPLASNDTERLKRGKTYEFEVSFKNPLEDVMKVRLGLVQPIRKSKGHRKGSTETSQRAPWSIRASTSRFSVKPSDDVDAVIDDDLLDDPRTRGASGQEDIDHFHEDGEDGFEDLSEGEAEGSAISGATKSRNPGLRAVRASTRHSNGLPRGVVRSRGNETVIALRLIVESPPTPSPPPQAKLAVEEEEGEGEGMDVEFAMRVTYMYRSDDDGSGGGGGGGGGADDRGQDGSAVRGKDEEHEDTGGHCISVWTAVRLGRLEPLSSAAATLSTAENAPTGVAGRHAMLGSTTGSSEHRTTGVPSGSQAASPAAAAAAASDPEPAAPASVSPAAATTAAADNQNESDDSGGEERDAEPAPLRTLPRQQGESVGPEDQAARLERLRKRRSEMFTSSSTSSS